MVRPHMVLAASIHFQRPILIISGAPSFPPRNVYPPPHWKYPINLQNPIIVGHYPGLHYVGTKEVSIDTGKEWYDADSSTTPPGALGWINLYVRIWGDYIPRGKVGKSYLAKITRWTPVGEGKAEETPEFGDWEVSFVGLDEMAEEDWPTASGTMVLCREQVQKGLNCHLAESTLMPAGEEEYKLFKHFNNANEEIKKGPGKKWPQKFGHIIQLNFNQKGSSHKTVIGGSLSLLIYTFMGFFILINV